MRLNITITGATPEQLARGVAAAEATFAAAGIAPLDAAWAIFRRERPDYPELTDAECAGCAAWEAADEAALAACCEGWSDRPTSARLELLDIPRAVS